MTENGQDVEWAERDRLCGAGGGSRKFLTIACGGKQRSYSLMSDDVVKLLRFLCRERKAHISQESLGWFIAELQAKAAYQGREYQVSVLVAEWDGRIYIDLIKRGGRSDRGDQGWMGGNLCTAASEVHMSVRHELRARDARLGPVGLVRKRVGFIPNMTAITELGEPT